MAASINDYFNLVNNGALAEPAQLAAPKQTTDTTASLTLATGWPTATAVHLALFKTNTDGTVDNSTVTYWKATLAGTTLSDMTLKGGTNQAYATGDSAVILSPYQFNDMVEGILKEHNQDGTHKDITTDNLTVSSSVTLPAGSIGTGPIGQGAVTAPKTDFGGDYSTSEVNTGFKWVDGKDIYKKTINFGTLPNSGAKNVAHGISNLGSIVHMFGTATDGTTIIPLPHTTVNTGFLVQLQVTSTNVTINSTADRSSSTGYVTLYYTKTS